MKQQISTPKAPAAIGPYSQAIQSGKLLFLSGQVSLDPATGEMVGTDASEQTVQIMKNLRAVLQAAGGDLSSLVKTTIFLTNLDDFGSVNEVYSRFFSAAPPARATVEVCRLPKEAQVEISGIAVLE